MSVCVCVCVSTFALSTHPSMDSCFHILAIINNAAINKVYRLCVCVCVCEIVIFVSFGSVPRSGIARSLGGYIFNF